MMKLLFAFFLVLLRCACGNVVEFNSSAVFKCAVQCSFMDSTIWINQTTPATSDTIIINVSSSDHAIISLDTSISFASFSILGNVELNIAANINTTQLNVANGSSFIVLPSSQVAVTENVSVTTNGVLYVAGYFIQNNEDSTKYTFTSASNGSIQAEGNGRVALLGTSAIGGPVSFSNSTRFSCYDCTFTRDVSLTNPFLNIAKFVGVHAELDGVGSNYLELVQGSTVTITQTAPISQAFIINSLFLDINCTMLLKNITGGIIGLNPGQNILGGGTLTIDSSTLELMHGPNTTVGPTMVFYGHCYIESESTYFHNLVFDADAYVTFNTSGTSGFATNAAIQGRIISRGALMLNGAISLSGGMSATGCYIPVNAPLTTGSPIILQSSTLVLNASLTTTTLYIYNNSNVYASQYNRTTTITGGIINGGIFVVDFSHPISLSGAFTQLPSGKLSALNLDPRINQTVVPFILEGTVTLNGTLQYDVIATSNGPVYFLIINSTNGVQGQFTGSPVSLGNLVTDVTLQYSEHGVTIALLSAENPSKSFWDLLPIWGWAAIGGGVVVIIVVLVVGCAISRRRSYQPIPN